MSSSTGIRGGFTLTWKIENFAYSGYSKGEGLKSPFYTVYSSGWALFVYPRCHGQDDGSYIDVSFYYEDDAFHYLFSILDSEGTPLYWKEAEHQDLPLKFITREELFGKRRSAFLPNNALMVQCRISKSGETSPIPEFRFARTRIQDNKKTLKWEIEKFDSLQPFQKIKNSFQPMTQYGSYINIAMCLNEEQRFQFDIALTKGGGSPKAFTSCKVVMVDAAGKKIEFADNEFFFDSAVATGQFVAYVTKNMLMCDQNLYLPNNTLTLMFECTLSSGVEFSRNEDLPEFLKQKVSQSGGHV